MAFIPVNNGEWECMWAGNEGECQSNCKGNLKNHKKCFAPLLSCSVCSEEFKKGWLWWRADKDIALCAECAEHTLNGLNRDLAEMKGDKDSKRQVGGLYNSIALKNMVGSLQKENLKLMKDKIVLQELLAKDR